MNKPVSTNDTWTILGQIAERGPRGLGVGKPVAENRTQNISAGTNHWSTVPQLLYDADEQQRGSDRSIVIENMNTRTIKLAHRPTL